MSRSTVRQLGAVRGCLIGLLLGDALGATGGEVPPSGLLTATSAGQLALYAAAARTESDWIMVKGISDWGMGKTDDCQQAAAQAAARFVVRFLQQGREDASAPAE